MDKSKGHLFYVYRYFIVHSGQLSLFNQQKGSQQGKNKIQFLVSECIEKNKIICDIADRKHILLFVKNISEDIALFKFSKDAPVTRYQLDDSDIIESRESNFPYVFVIIDTKQQLICLEHKTNVFAKIEICKNSFSSFVDHFIHDLNYTFSMDEISDSGSFWDNVQNAERIYQLQLNLRSPNLFGGIYETNAFLKKIKELFNNDECAFNLKNSAGNLNITKEAMDDPLQYASSGGGSWKLTITKKGRKKKTTVSSKKSVKTLEINDFEERYSLFGKNNIIDKIHELGTLPEKEDQNK